MSPEQLKEYVDAALKQRQGFTTLYFIATPILAFVASFLGSYLKAKAKNVATKEDIAEITGQIEAAKSVYTEKLEQLKADLVARSHFSKVRYEREMKIYEDIWPKVFSLREAVLWLRPVMDVPLIEGQTKESRNQERETRYADASMTFSKAVENNRPFYPDEIWSKLLHLDNLCWGEAVESKFPDPRPGKGIDWANVVKKSKEITAQVDEICEAIRTRLKKFDEV